MQHPQATRHDGGHVPELDGLRGLAVLLVVARHWQAEFTSGVPLDTAIRQVASVGWLGVEIFFVLSGYLITGILLRERANGRRFRAYLGRFMWRRALRIAPLYYAALVVLFVIVPAVIPIRDPAFATLQYYQRWFWLYGVNWLEAVRGMGVVPFQTGHLWSVAVEEQFYLVWPLLVWLAGPRRLPWLAVLLWLGSIAARAVVGPDVDPVRVTTPLHLDSLMAGALLAWAATTPHWPGASRWLRWMTLPALAVLLPLVWQGQRPTWLPALAGAGLVASALTLAPSHPWRVVCRAGWLRRYGLWSYCLYLVHYPLTNVINRGLARVTIPHPFGSTLLYGAIYGVLLLGVSTGLAALSWRYFERPILSLKDRPLFLHRRGQPSADLGLNHRHGEADGVVVLATIGPPHE